MSSKMYGKSFLKGARKYRVQPDFQDQAIRSFLSSLDCPRSLAVWLLYESGEHDQLIDLGFDPLHYVNSVDVRDAYTATKFLSKFKGLTLNRDLDEVALEKFSFYEDLCMHTNARFKDLSRDRLFTGRAVRLHNAVTRKVDKILGEFSVEEFFDSPDWGPGATTLIKRRDASAANKFQLEAGITRDLYALLPPILFEKVYPHWYNHIMGSFPNFQIGSKVITVPKDASTNRVIAVEPGINLWYQKSVGEMIRRRLLRVGINLKDQSRNQLLARLSSVDGTLATVDLSSASDSISKSVVRELLPPKWFSIMDKLRTHYGLVNGSWVKWNKFSSMGNGFTFPLESLIFYAIAICCAEDANVDGSLVSVYGDDVILPTSLFTVFSVMLEFYGFVVNEKKSYFSSSFRESCGAHYSNGLDCKPFFLREELSNLQSVYRLHNGIKRLASRWGAYPFYLDARFFHCCVHLISRVPVALRLRVPEGFGDGGFVSNFDESSPSKCRHGVEGYHVVHLTETSRSMSFEAAGYLLASLWSLHKRSSRSKLLEGQSDRLSARKAIRSLTDLDSAVPGRNSVPTDRIVLRVSKGSVVRQWTDLGRWFDFGQKRS